MWDPSHGCSPPSLGCAYWFFGISIGVPNFFDLMEPLKNLYGLKKIDLTKILRTPCMEKGIEFFLDWQWWAELTSPTCPGKVLPSRLASFMGFPCLGASTWWNQRFAAFISFLHIQWYTATLASMQHVAFLPSLSVHCLQGRGPIIDSSLQWPQTFHGLSAFFMAL